MICCMFIRCISRSKDRPAEVAYESVFRPEMLEQWDQQHEVCHLEEIGTDVKASVERKESRHDGHPKGPRDAIARWWVGGQATLLLNCNADRVAWVVHRSRAALAEVDPQSGFQVDPSRNHCQPQKWFRLVLGTCE